MFSHLLFGPNHDPLSYAFNLLGLMLGFLGIIAQDALYIPTLNLNQSVIDYSWSLYTCVFYLVMLKQVGTFISASYTQCLQLQQPLFESSCIPKLKKSKHKHRRRHTESHAQATNDSSAFDQFVSSVKGRLPFTFGKEHEREKLSGGTIFVDEASDYMYVHNQVSLNVAETLIGKANFEREAMRHGILIKSYRGDNGIYRSAEFQEDLKRKNQPMVYSGVGAHHHNGVAERAIRTVSTNARTMLLHAMVHWPEETSLELWPFAVEYAVHLWNLLPREPSGLSPTELFYGVKSHHSSLKNAKVFGCPTYVLDPRLQDGKKIPKWEPRSKVGQFVGRSAVHSSTVGLIRNIETGKVSAQFHVVYDNHFSTCSVTQEQTATSFPKEWLDLFEYKRECHFDPNDVKTEPTSQLEQLKSLPQLPRSPIPEGGKSTSPGSPASKSILKHKAVSTPEGAADNPIDLSKSDSGPTQVPSPSPKVEIAPPPSPNPPSLRRSVRVTKPNSTIFNDNFETYHSHHYFQRNYSTYISELENLSYHDAYLTYADLSGASSYMTRQFDLIHEMKQDPLELDNCVLPHPFPLSAKANADDSPNFNEAMSSPDREGFIDAMHKEINQLEDFGAWDVVPRSKALKAHSRILAVTWVFKRKRYPDGSVKKLKARICVRGDQQVQDVDYFDTFSPVVQWSTIRLMFILSILLNLKTIQVDYTLAFVQAPADPGTFLEMPKLFEIPGMILELKRNLYGQCDSPKKFYEYLKKGLMERGLVPSPHDHCLFMSKEVSVVTCVDDCIFFAKDEAQIRKLIKSLQEPPDKFCGKWNQFLLSEEEDYAGFLGIDISTCKDDENVIELLQTGLIDRVSEAVGLGNTTVGKNMTPSRTTLLGKDENGPPRQSSWNYASVIGMLLYLASDSRPDIAFSVHQAARFTHCAKLSHEKAVIQIVKYLKSTKDKGLRINPKTTLNLELYANADFAGLWNIEHPEDAICVKSRSGFMITLGGVPITWSSKLQTEIATSTMHAEYIALSSGMRELLPVRNKFEYICKELGIQRDKETKLVKVWEDNEGALKLAGSAIQKVTPHTKHFAIKYHWFREKFDELQLVIKYVDTHHQKADILTKGLTLKEFEIKRNMIMGW